MKNDDKPKKILLKLSGEILQGSQGFGINQESCRQLAKNLEQICLAGMRLAIVIGGGNIFRGINVSGQMARTPADHMGMLSTLLNGIALKQALEAIGLKTSVLSGLECPRVVETFNESRAMDYLDSGRLLIFVGGTGSPYFTTDTAAALRACEIQADLLLKATKVDGVYDKDPIKHPDAVKFDQMTYTDVLLKGLKVMDASAIALCQTNRVPIVVFNMQRLNEPNFIQKLLDFRLGTWIED